MARTRGGRRSLVATAIALGVLFLGLAAPGGAAARPRPAQSFTVVAEGGPHPFTWAWGPAEVTVVGRGRVTWENPTDAVHHVTFWDGPHAESQHLEAGATATLRFRNPGVYEYLCDIIGHADLVYVGTERICVGMCGRITVE